MDVKTDPLLMVQRLRYEAFSVFATELNKCLSYIEVCQVLASQIKFVIDAFAFRVFYRYQSSVIICEIYQGEYRFSEDASAVYPFERQLIVMGLPATYEGNELIDNSGFAGTIFDNEKISLISTLPISHADDNQILVTVASRQKEHSISIDFRFLKLISEIISNKLFQLKLMANNAAINEDLKLKNDQINRLNENLSKMVAARTKELKQSNKELTTLFYRTSHDFRAPLANIMGLANVAPLMTSDTEALNLFQQCKEVAEGMADMLTKLNFLTDNFEQGWQPINFNEFVSLLDQKYTQQINQCDGKLTSEITHCANYFSNIEVLNIAIDCLIDNSITFREQSPHIHIKIFSKNGWLFIEVTDNGQGIDKQIKSKIFDMYYRGNSLSTGHGLGLYITKKILKLIKGDIKVSVAGKRTSFIIKLPL